MPWIKKGRIFAPDRQLDWAAHSFMTPTPWQRDADTIRLFGGMRDDKGVSRIGWIDVESEDPSIIKGISKKPVLDVGIPGTFDDNGIILGDLLDVDGRLRMYYVGFQLVDKVKFLAFTGLAFSDDGGDTFTRFKRTPVLDRADNALYFRAIHTIFQRNGAFHAWCGAGSNWRLIDGVPYPSYEIWHAESPDGLQFGTSDTLVIEPGENEYRIGRPRVHETAGGLEMYFTYDTCDKRYASGFASSLDGIHWQRDDSRFTLQTSESGWDSQMVCYPARHETPSGNICFFYSGNGMGRSGVGFAQWQA